MFYRIPHCPMNGLRLFHLRFYLIVGLPFFYSKIFFRFFKVASGVMIAVGIYAKVAKENGTEVPFLSH